METISYTVRVDVGDETGPFLNTAIVTVSDAPGGNVLFEDRSEDGTDPDPSGDDDPNSDPDACEADPFDPDCEDTPTTIDMFPMQVIGIAKEASAPRQVGPSTYDIDFSFVVENFGTIPATNVQVTDDLSATFPGVTSIEVVGTPDVGGLTPADPAYDGTSQIALLAGADTLAVDAVETITFTVRVDLGAETGPFLNTAIVTASDTPGGNVLYEDRSEDGNDPDPSGDDNPNSDPDACAADPFDPNCEDTPTTIDLFPSQVIGIAKQAGVPQQVGPSTYDVDLSFVVENLGSIPATNIQVTDDLAATFAGAVSIQLQGTPDVGGLTAADPAYDGVNNIALLAGTDSLDPGAVETIALTVRVDVGSQTGPFDNQATVTVADSPDGSAIFTDLSDDGTDPDPSGDNDPNSDPDACTSDPFSPACEDTPTRIVLPVATPVIGIAKQASEPIQILVGVYRFNFSFVVENLGTVPATNVQVEDDLVATFPGAAQIAVVGAPNVGGLTPADPAYDGVNQTALLAGTDTLAPGAVETISFAVTVDLGSQTGPFENQAVVTIADTPGGPAIFTDLSDDGPDPDPSGDGNPNSDPDACLADPFSAACEDTPTLLTLPSTDPVVGIAKRLVEARPLGGSVYEFDFSFVVENFSALPVTNVQVTDDLAMTFLGAASIEVLGSPDVGSLTPADPAYDGVDNLGLLAGTDQLASGAVETILLTVRVDVGGQAGPFENQATVVAESVTGTVFTDLSDDGTDPDPSGDNDPNSDPDACIADPFSVACEDTPTVINLPANTPVIGIAKQASTPRQVAVNTFDVDLSFVVENLGAVPATNVQVTDDLAVTFPGVTTLQVVGAPDVGGLTAASPAFDGVDQTALLSGTDSLNPGATETIRFTVRVELGAQTGPFENQASVSVADTPGGPTSFVDLSDDGTDPDPSGDDNPNSDPDACVADRFSPACEDTPTVIQFPLAIDPVIGIAKQASAPRQTGPTTYELDFSFVVENLGPIPAPNVQVTDDLSVTFPGVTSIEVLGAPEVGTLTAATSAYDGINQTAFLTGDDTLDIGQLETITVTLRIDLGSQSGPFENQAIVTSAVIPGGTPIATDLSDDGADPDPSGDGNPNSDPDACTADPFSDACEDTPTVINMFPMQVIGLAKQATTAVQVGLTSFQIDLDFVVENLGTIAATNVQVIDDLTATFPGAVAIDAEIINITNLSAAIPAYDGVTQTNFLTGADTLQPGEIGTVRVRAIVDLGAAEGTFENQASVTVADTPGGTALFTDLSDDGTDPDPSGDGNPNSDPAACLADPTQAACEDTPTVIVIESDQPEGATILIDKQVDRPVALPGELLSYTIRVANQAGFQLTDVTVEDTLPAAGFSVVPESAILVRAGADGQLDTLDDVTTPLAIDGVRPITFGPFVLEADETLNLRYVVRIGATVSPGTYENVAVPLITDTPTGPPDRVPVTIEADPLLQQTTIIGKVFFDVDRDGYPDEGEPGIPGVRIATVSGLLIETDAFGRYHIADVDGGRFDRGRNFIAKVDPVTLPAGHEFTTENPRVLRITQGLMSEINFGVWLPNPPAIEKVEEVEVNEELFFGYDQDRLEPGEPADPDGPAKLAELKERLKDATEISLRIIGNTEKRGPLPPTERIVRELDTREYTLIPRFPILSAELQAEDKAKLDEIISEWANAEEIEISVEGHTSSVRIAPRSRHIFADNYELSWARARSVGDYVAQALGVAPDKISADGKGPDNPVDSNLTLGGRAANRRTELTMSGKVPVERKVFVDTPAPRQEGFDPEYDYKLGERRAEHVADTIECDDCVVGSAGREEPRSTNETEAGRADNRRVDIVGSYKVDLQEGGEVWATEDPSRTQPTLNVGAPRAYPADGAEPITFRVHTNYAAFVDRWELAIYPATDTDLSRPWRKLSGNGLQPGQGIEWDVRELDKQFGPVQRRELVYVLTVYDAEGNFDRTQPRALELTRDDESREDFDELPEYDGLELIGVDNRAVAGIPIRGSLVRIHGSDIAPDRRVFVGEQPVPVDKKGTFAVEQVLPIGEHVIPFSVARQQGEDWRRTTVDLPVDVTGKYFFMVGLADLTVGANDEVDVEPLSGDERYDGDVFVDGRIAFYLKGKVKGKYLITAQLDTTEDDIDNIFGDLDEEDPRTIFRHLDPDRFYPVYGDDSTTIADADSLGRFFVRLEWDRSQALWGNFNTAITGNEFIEYNRSLYGAMLDFDARKSTKFGQPQSQLDLFASEAQTAFAHDEFRATGGSLYYLRETDVVQGSAKIWIEVRDRDSERVIERKVLQLQRDYEIDEIQGRILLARPLSQIAPQAAPNLIKDDPLDGNDVFLLADYEYVPDGFGADQWTVGGRGKWWAGDHVAIGGTYINEERDAQDYELQGADVTVQIAEGTYVKTELAQSEATQAAQAFTSADGGLTFNALSAAGATQQRSGDAMSVETRVDARDFSEVDATASAWWKQREEGFSTARLDEGVELRDYGAEFLWNSQNGVVVGARGSVVDRENVRRDERYSVQAGYDAGKLDFTGELRHVEQETATGNQEADLAAVRVGVDVGERTNIYAVGQTTLDNSDNFADDDRGTLGVRSQVHDRLALRGEVSTGDRGDGVAAGVDYQVSDDVTLRVDGGAGGVGDAVQAGADWRVNDQQTIYGSYTLSQDRTEDQRGVATIGQRSQLSNNLNVFTEGQFAHSDQAAGLTQVYGLDFRADEFWTVGLSLQRSELDDGVRGDLDRDAASFWTTFRKGASGFSSKLEYRADRGPVDQDQWLVANRGDLRMNPNWTLLGKLDASITEPEVTDIRTAKYMEGSLGVAYRPVNHTRWNVLGKYTYLYDLPSLGQRPNRTDQRSQVFSIDVLRDLGRRWSIGGKLAAKQGELRAGRDSGAWFENDLNLAVVRARYHLIQGWDGLAEYRMLWSDEAEDERRGFLLGVYRHLGAHAKLGVGYNFVDINDDLTNVDEDSNGWFLNAIGKF